MNKRSESTSYVVKWKLLNEKYVNGNIWWYVNENMIQKWKHFSYVNEKYVNGEWENEKYENENEKYGNMRIMWMKTK